MTEQTREQVLEELREHKAKFKSLIEHPGWAVLIKVVEAQALARENPVLRNATTGENLGEHNFMKGEANGMRALLALPKTVVETATQQLNEAEDESE